MSKVKVKLAKLVKLAKPVKAQCGKTDRCCTCCSPVTTLCRFQCGVLEVCFLASAVLVDGITAAATRGGVNSRVRLCRTGHMLLDIIVESIFLLRSSQTCMI